MPFALWHVLATLSEYVPGAPLTRDQIALMQNDNVASPDFPRLRELGVEPTPVDAVLDEVGHRAAASGLRQTALQLMVQSARRSERSRRYQVVRYHPFPWSNVQPISSTVWTP